MDLETLKTKVARSSEEHWERLSEDGPTYLDRLGEVSGGGQHWIEIDTHHSRAVFVEDVSIGLAWGMPPSFMGTDTPDWAENFPDPKVIGGVVEVLWNGQPVVRERYAYVDGRSYVPYPWHRDDRLVVTRFSYDLVRVAASLGSTGHDYAQYVERCGFEVVDFLP